MTATSFHVLRAAHRAIRLAIEIASRRCPTETTMGVDACGICFVDLEYMDRRPHKSDCTYAQAVELAGDALGTFVRGMWA